MSEHKLSVNLVTYNGEKYLPFCFNSLKNQTFKNFDLKIIDNGSSDNTQATILDHFPQIKTIAYKNNVGFAKAHNQLINWSSEPYVLILNQDVILAENYLEQIINWLEKNPAVAGVQGKILRWDFFQNEKTGIIDSLGLEIYQSRRVADIGQGINDKKGQDDTPQKQNGPKEVFGLNGAAPIFRRTALERVKVRTSTKNQAEKYEYFDEDFFSYKEDVDLAYRIQLAGLKSCCLREAIAYHSRGVGQNGTSIKESRSKQPSDIKIYSYKNHLSAIYKNEFFTNYLKYFWPLVWYEFKKLAYLLIFEPATLKGLKMFFKEKKKMKAKRKFIIKNIRKIKAGELATWYQKN